MKEIKHYCKREANDLIFENQGLWEAHLKALPDGKRLVVTICVYHPVRSNPQNSYYWAVIVEYFAKAIGERDKDIVHESLKNHFLKMPHKDNPDFMIVGSTKKLTTVEFWDYCESCRDLYRDMFDGEIPDPYVTGYLT